MRKTETKKGFTLLELMVAMGVIAILAAMSIYGISLVQRSLRNTARRKAADDINLAVQQYFEARAEYPDANSTTGIYFYENRVTINGQEVYTFTGSTRPSIANNNSGVDSSFTRYCYEVTANNSSYKLSVDLEGNSWGLQLGEPSLPNCDSPIAIH